MKKKLSLLLLLSLVLSLASCGASENQADTTPLSSPVAAEEQVSEIPQDSLVSEAPADDRGIPGMKAATIRLLLDSSFGVPWTDNVPAPDEAESIYAFSCSSTGSNEDNIVYDYSITMDEDEEIIGATFGVSASGNCTQQELLSAADLYFYALAILPYDTADEDTVVTWFEDALSNSTTDGESISVGDATFTLYGSPSSMYWADISKTE